jgi:UDP-N-acetylglucosamine 2-epimerase (non-hydrolysing)
LKIMTILGTRPEIIRLSIIISKLDRSCEHVLIHTGQNYDPTLSDIFFRDLGVRKPDRYLGVNNQSIGEQIGNILSASEKVLTEFKPDRLLLLGDTDSALAAIVAKRLNIPVYHMEAGNRCYDDRVPEEVNRRIIDHCSDVLMPYTERSRMNLLREGIAGERIYVIGNPIWEVLNYNEQPIDNSIILNKMNLKPQEYFLLTLHRAENVDLEERLQGFTKGFKKLSELYQRPIVCSLHPRTSARLKKFGLAVPGKNIIVTEPLSFFDFVKLEKNALVVLSDSGTVQEECCIFGVPTVTLRDVTERPETLEVGSNMLSGNDPDLICNSVKLVIEEKAKWQPPAEYVREQVSRTVLKILLGYRSY